MITQERLIEKISALPYGRLPEVEQFVDSVAVRPTRLSPEEEESLIFEYAEEFGGTEFDLDPMLEAAGLEALARLAEDEK